MKNIIYSQLRQLFKNKLKFIVLLICCFLGGIQVFGMYVREFDLVELSASQLVVSGWNTVVIMVLFFASVSVGDICGCDFGDKTIYTELMSGRRRSTVFFGRAVVAIVFTLIGSLMIVCAPILIAYISFGWGNIVSPDVMWERLFILIVPLLRIICEFICITFIVKNRYIVIGIAFGFVEFTSIAGALFQKAPDELLGMTSFMNLCSFDFWVTYGLDDQINMMVNTELPVSTIVSIYVCSLIGAAAALVIGYSFFHRDDLD